MQFGHLLIYDKICTTFHANFQHFSRYGWTSTHLSLLVRLLPQHPLIILRILEEWAMEWMEEKQFLYVQSVPQIRFPSALRQEFQLYVVHWLVIIVSIFQNTRKQKATSTNQLWTFIHYFSIFWSNSSLSSIVFQFWPSSSRIVRCFNNKIILCQSIICHFTMQFSKFSFKFYHFHFRSLRYHVLQDFWPPMVAFNITM